MTRTKIADAIFLVRFRTQYELAATFLRFQEHYESSRFAGRIFSLEQFMDWYAAKFGSFSYYEDWSGFNVPSTALAPFYGGQFDPLLEKEKQFLDLFRDERAPFYVLGVTEAPSIDDLTHELAHALFFMAPRYRKAVRAAMRGHDTSSLERALRERGYRPGVIMDEVHAYLVAPGAVDSPPTRKLAPLRKQLRAIFRRHSASVLKKSSGGRAVVRAPRQARPGRSVGRDRRG